MTEQGNMEKNEENGNSLESTEQRILEIRAEIAEIQRETADIRKRTADIQQESADIRRESDRRSTIAEAKFNKEMDRISQVLAEVSETSRHHGQQIGGYGNQIGDFTESLAMPSIRRILERFNAEFQGRVDLNWSDQDGPLEVDAWGVSRNGTNEVYLVEIKRKFKSKHIGQVRRLVKRFRGYFPKFGDSPIYPFIAAVEINEIDRGKLWKEGMYVINISDGVFELAEAPAEVKFKPDGGYGIPVRVRKAVPPLNLVWDSESERRKVQ